MRALLAVLMLIPIFAMAAPHDVHVTQVNSSGSGTVTRVIPVPPADSVIYYHKSSNTLRAAHLGVGLSLSTGALTASGITGKSAYQIAVDNGFAGTEVDWLESLKGEDGSPGANGTVGPQGPAGADGANGLNGEDGKSAYQVAVENGFIGSESAWLASLKGETGDTGPVGPTGATGPAGAGLSSITHPARSLNSSFTVSATRPAFVSYNVKLEVTNPLLAGSASATATLQYSTDGGTTWTTVNTASSVATVGLTVSVAILSTHEQIVSGFIPANALVRVQSSTAGVGTVTLLRGQEVLF